MQQVNFFWHRLNGHCALALLMLGAITCLFFFPVLRGATFSDVASRQNTLYPWAMTANTQPPIMHYDQTDVFYPRQVFLSRALRAGEFPLWNPYGFAGQPFFANGASGVLYPLRALFALTVEAARAHDLMIITHTLLSGLMMYLLLGSARLSFVAALFGAVAWMLNSFMLAWNALEQSIIIGAWLPLAFLLLERAVMHYSWPASFGLALVLALIFLGDNLLFVEMAFLVWGGYAGYLLLGRWWRAGSGRATTQLARQDLAITVVPLLLFAGLIAVQLLPTLDLVRYQSRSPYPYEQFKDFRLESAYLNYFFTPPRGLADPYHAMLFLGTPTAVLALIGALQRHTLARYARWVALIILAVVCGTAATWAAYHFVPSFSHFKPLGRLLFLFNFAVAILAAFGLDWLVRYVPRQPDQQSWDRGRLGRSARAASIVALGAVAAWVAFQLWPVLGEFRPAARMALLFIYAEGVLVAFVFGWNTVHWPRSSSWRWQSGVLALAALLAASGVLALALRYRSLPGYEQLKAVLRSRGWLDPSMRALFIYALNLIAAVLVAFALSKLLRRLSVLSQRWREALAYGLIAIVVVQMYAVGQWVMRAQPNDPAYLYPETPLVRALSGHEETRILPLYPAFYGATPMIFDLQSGSGYDAMLPDRIVRLWRVAQGSPPEQAVQTTLHWAYAPTFLVEPPPSDPVLGNSAEEQRMRFDLLPRLGITEVITPPAIDLARTGWNNATLARARLELTYHGADGNVYRVANPLPRAYLIARCERAETALTALQRFASTDFDPSRAVLIEAAYLPERDACDPPAKAVQPDVAPGAAQITKRGLNTLTVRVNATQAAWLVINESWDAGWKATVDGQPATVLPGNYSFRTLRVPAGEHTVELRYRPTAFVVGSAISAGTLALLLGLGIVQWMKRSHQYREQ